MAQPAGKRVKMQKVPGSEPAPLRSFDILAEVCFYYPGYTLQTAAKLPFRQAIGLIKQARKLEAARYYNLTQIAAAAQTEKLKGVESLLKHYQEIMNAR